MKFEATINNPSRSLLDFLFPYRNKQLIKKDLRKHCGSIYYNLSLKRKLELITYWRSVLEIKIKL